MRPAAYLVGVVLLLTGCQRQNARQMVEGLAGGDGVACFAALREDEDSRQAVLAGLAHRSARVRGQCARLLGMSQDVTVVSRLQPLLIDGDLGVRQQTARAMISLLDSGELLELLQSNEMALPARAALAQAMLRDPAELSEKPFVDWLLDRSHPNSLRAFLYRVLRESHSPGYGQGRPEKLLPLVEQARKRILAQARADAGNEAESVEVRSGALPLVATLARGQAYGETLAIYKAPRVPLLLREAALTALGCTRREEALKILVATVSDAGQTTSMRLAAINGLTHLGSTQVLYTLLEDPDPKVRGKSAMALSCFNEPAAVKALQHALEGELDEETQAVMRLAIRRLENRNTCPPCP